MTQKVIKKTMGIFFDGDLGKILADPNKGYVVWTYCKQIFDTTLNATDHVICIESLYQRHSFNVKTIVGSLKRSNSMYCK